MYNTRYNVNNCYELVHMRQCDKRKIGKKKDVVIVLL